MEEHDEENSQPDMNTAQGESQSSSAGGQVMDVTAPQSTDDESTVQQQQTAPSLGVESPQPSQETEPHSNAAMPLTGSNNESPGPQITNGPEEHNEQSSHGHKTSHQSMPAVAIIIAVVVAIVLASLVLLAYSRNNSGDINRNDTSNATNESSEASATDVDTTNKEIDSALDQADDTADLPESELSDTTLGL